MKYLNIILTEMFDRVGAEYDPEIVSTDGWYTKCEWTKAEEDDFRKWLSDLLYTDKKARDEIMGFPRKNKKACDDTAAWFITNYGWKYKI